MKLPIRYLTAAWRISCNQHSRYNKPQGGDITEQVVFSDDWYALFVRTGKEDQVKDYILKNSDGKLRAVVPKRKLKERKGGSWSYVIRTLFPGYVLLNGDIEDEKHNYYKDIPGAIKLLRGGYEPLKIEKHEIWTISSLICDDETIGFSSVMIKGGRVVVVDGPLVSMEGLIVDINRRKERAKVRLNFMGEPRIVELGISVLQPV